MRHFYQLIQGWFSFSDVYIQAVKEAPKDHLSNFVEIGAWKGKSTAFMGVEVANSGKHIKFYAVDTFLGSDETAHKQDQDIIDGTLYKTFKQNINPVQDYINVLRMTSVEAAELFYNDAIDFLFIDGDHSLDGVTADINAWLPKMKPNGVIGFDDYNWPGVKQAVHEHFEESKIEVLLFGTKGCHCRVRL